MVSDWTAEEQRVLQTFLKGERIVQLPVKLKKRRVVLRWLLDYVDPTRTYDESEINALISRHHPDYATIRREWVAFDWMQRDHGIYRRTSAEPNWRR